MTFVEADDKQRIGKGIRAHAVRRTAMIRGDSKLWLVSTLRGLDAHSRIALDKLFILCVERYRRCSRVLVDAGFGHNFFGCC